MKKTYKNAFALFLAFLSVFMLLACNMAEETTYYTRNHKEPEKTMLEIQSGDIRNYDQLTSALEDIISAGIKSEILTVVNYAGNLVEDLDKVTEHLINQYPLGVYSVASIVYKPNFIATYCELEVLVSYSRSYSDINNIVQLVERYDLFSRMGDMISQRDTSNTYQIRRFRLDLDTLYEAFDMQWANSGVYAYGVKDVTFIFYPSDYWDEYILEVKFDYTESLINSIETAEKTLEKAKEVVKDCNASTTDGKIEYVLDYIKSNVVCDWEASRVVEETNGRQPKTSGYTATGALLEGCAAQSGIVIATSVLLKELDVENTVICGLEDGATYYWISVDVNGTKMHIDPCAVYTNHGACYMDEEQADERFDWNTTLYNMN